MCFFFFIHLLELISGTISYYAFVILCVAPCVHCCSMALLWLVFVVLYMCFEGRSVVGLPETNFLHGGTEVLSWSGSPGLLHSDSGQLMGAVQQSDICEIIKLNKDTTVHWGLVCGLLEILRYVCNLHADITFGCGYRCVRTHLWPKLNMMSRCIQYITDLSGQPARPWYVLHRVFWVGGCWKWISQLRVDMQASFSSCLNVKCY